MERRVSHAEPYRFGAMHYSNPRPANNMLIRQFEFPDIYEERDKFWNAYGDRLPYEQRKAAGDRHLPKAKNYLNWLRDADPLAILAYLKDLLKASNELVWTGFRVTGYVNRASGYEVYYYCLFAKHPESKTKTYSGDRAPNIQTDFHGPPIRDGYYFAKGLIWEDGTP